MSNSTNINANTNTIMSATEEKRILNLEGSLKGYRGIMAFMVLAIIVLIIMYTKYPDAFIPKFGYSIILTVIIIFIFLAIWNFYSNFIKSNPNATLEDLMSKNGKWTSVGAFTVVAATIIGLCFGIISMLGSEKNNLGLLINYIVVLLLMAISVFIFKKSSADDSKILEKLPKHTQMFFNERKKFTIIFAIFVILVIGLYIYNPAEVMTKYGGATIFLTIFVGTILLLVIKVYDYYYTDPKKSAELKGDYKDMPRLYTFLKGFYILFGLVLSGLFFYWVINALGLLDQEEDKGSKNYIIKTIVNIVFLIGMFSVLYKLVNAGGYFSNNPLFRLIFNTILYIPCLLVIIADFITDLFNKKPAATAAAEAVTAATTLHGATTPKGTKSPVTKTPYPQTSSVSSSKSEPWSWSPFTFPSPIIFGNTTRNDLIFLCISVSVCGLYVFFNNIIIPYGMTTYYKLGGKQLINNPVSTDILTNVATYQKLNGSDRITYKYAISFWFYIDSFPPSTGSAYLKTVPILSYGDNPSVKYHGPSNSIIITVKQTSEGSDIVSSMQKLETNIKKENIEKWNAIQDKLQSGIEQVKALPIGNEEDGNGNRIIYKRSNILLQKWNNIVINYNGGTLDVFYNGELVKSAIEVVPKINYDMLTVGTDNGINGHVANLMYFDHSLNYLTVNRLYNMLKDKNPPTISTIDKTLIPIPDQVTNETNQATSQIVNTYNKTTDQIVDTYNKTTDQIVDTYNKTTDQIADTFNKTKGEVADTFNKNKSKAADTFNKNKGKTADTFNKGTNQFKNFTI